MTSLSLKKKNQLIRVRRLMIAGLIASAFGNSVVEAGFDATTAAGLVAVGFLVAIKTLEQIAVFFFPLYARVVSRYSPDSALIGVDLAETLLSFVAVILIVTNTLPSAIVLTLFVLVDSLLAPISDIADEFYGAVLADVDEDIALGFNAFLYSAVATLGFVVGGPLGSYFASMSIVTLLVANIFLSLGGAAFRLYARHEWAAPPLEESDDEDWQATGESMPVARFFKDLFLSGPASPLLSLLIRVASALTGELFLLWAARTIGDSNFVSSAYSGMGVVLVVFGVAAAVGPLLASWVKKKTNVEFVLRLTAFGAAALIMSFVAYTHFATINSFAILSFIFIIVVLNRIRVVVLETYRQVVFKGKQFARIMSWSYSFGAVGTLIGLQVGYFTDLAFNPTVSLLIAVGLWTVIGLVVTIPNSFYSRSETSLKE
ncbi:MFS transporter [Actinomyces vulturis]|uniref:MFS transporter n=1 Tax=Actinomyces vulturis TaxID=1857645 RepID=UPI000830D5FE|nr:MFS transporter [Actinomyces vulturis]